MKMYLDDVRPMPDGFDVAAKSYQEAVRLLATGCIKFISFDHDLGTKETGHDLANLIEKAANKGTLEPILWEIHSANPVGRKNIEEAMRGAQRIWRKAYEARVKEYHVTHEMFLKKTQNLPTDFAPYGTRDRDKDWAPDCSCGCLHFRTLDGLAGGDWGVCSNPKSPRAGLLTFEHAGCPQYEDEPEADPPKLADLAAKMAERAKGRKS